MFRSIRDWWLCRGIARQVKCMGKRLERLDEEYLRASTDLAAQQEAFNRMMEEQQDKLNLTIDSHQRLLKRSDEALDTERAKLRVAEKTVETLVAANKLHTDRYDAESAIQTRRRVAASEEGEDRL